MAEQAQPMSGTFALAPARPARLVFTVSGVIGIIGMLFLLPLGAMDVIGYDYNSVSGSPVSKIHPATYLSLMVAVVFLLENYGATGLWTRLLSQNILSLYFLSALLYAFLFVTLSHRNGLGTVFDSFALALILHLIFPDLSERFKANLETFLHWFFVVNAAMAILELVLDYRVFPASWEGEPMVDSRATALLGHPLSNAALTGTYVVCLLAGAGRKLSGSWKFCSILLQLLALIAFGGRTAIVTCFGCVTVYLLWQVWNFACGKRASMSTLILAALLAPCVVVGVLGLGYFGFFDAVIARLQDDSGSAQTRLWMLDLVGTFSFSELLIGIDPDLLASRRYSEGLLWGVENPLVHMLLTMGIICCTFIWTGLLAFLVELVQGLRRGAIFPVAYFWLETLSYQSWGSRFVGVSICVLMVSTLFRFGAAEAAVVVSEPAPRSTSP